MVTSHSVLLFADPVPCLITQTNLRISLGLFTESVSSSRGALFLGQRDRLLLFSFLLTLSSFSDDVNDVMSQAAAVAVMWQPPAASTRGGQGCVVKFLRLSNCKKREPIVEAGNQLGSP